MSNYRRGVDLERALVRYLRKEGWEAARSASSKSAVDVWAVRDGEFRAYQCVIHWTRAKASAVRRDSERIGTRIELVTKEQMDEWKEAA